MTGRLATRLALFALAAALAVSIAGWQRHEDACAEAGAQVLREITGAADRSVLPAARAALLDDCHDSAAAVSAAGALNQAGREGEAESLVRAVVREEPDSFAAWAVLSLATADSDPAASARARERALALNPLAAH